MLIFLKLELIWQFIKVYQFLASIGLAYTEWSVYVDARGSLAVMFIEFIPPQINVLVMFLNQFHFNIFFFCLSQFLQFLATKRNIILFLNIKHRFQFI